MGQKRRADLPDVQTFAENGLDGYEAAFWFGLTAPANTPKPILERLNKEVARVLALPDVHEKMLAQAIEPVSSSIAEYDAFVRRDIEKWARVVKAAGIKPE
jgi:tripartite-type tricarboxylate transporter receptor subunit TctC